MSRSERDTARGTALITGAGRGIGRATAFELARAGHPLVLVSRSAAALDETAAYCAQLVPTECLMMDVRDEAQVAVLPAVLDRTPGLEVVVNNAGIGEWSPIEQLSLESWAIQVDTNLRGPFLIIRETLPYFRRQGGGLYVNVGSDCSLVGMPHRAAYNASKFGLVGLTASLRAEVGAEGIHACLVYAGKTDTHFRGHQPGDRPGALEASDVARVIAFVVAQYPRAVVAEVSVFPPGESLSGPRSLV